MTLLELGTILLEERTRKGIQIDDAAVKLKISPRVLRGIEEGDPSEVPHPVYLRGFIKSYALLLGLPQEEIQAHLAQLTLSEEEEEKQVNLDIPAPAEPSPTIRKKHKFRLLIQLLILTVVAGGIYAYYISNLRGSSWSFSSVIASFTGSDTQNSASAENSPQAQLAERPKDSQGTIPALLSSSIAPTTPNTLPSTAQNANAQPLQNQENLSQPAPQLPAAPSVPGAPGTLGAPSAPQAGANAALQTPALPAANASTGQPASIIGATGTASEAAPVTSQFHFPAEAGPGTATQITQNTPPQEETPVAMPDGMHQVVVTAEADCWIHAKADSTINRQFILKTGETFSLPFKTTLSMRLGNAGGVKIKYDGKDIGNPGKSGQAMTVEFPPKAQ